MDEHGAGSDYPFFFTWAAQRGTPACELSGGEGVYFHTTDGSRWLDFGSLRYNANLGHGEQRIVDASTRQAHSTQTTPSRPSISIFVSFSPTRLPLEWFICC